MNVYVTPEPWMGKGIKRVADALTRYVPEGVRVMAKREAADLEVLHVVGWGSIPDDLGARPYAIVQYCLATTEDANPERWLDEVWSGAAAVWSYYDLPLADRFAFYYAPLGVDGSVFRLPTPGSSRRIFRLGTTGYVAESEAVGECARAVYAVGGSMAHLGPDLGVPGNVSYKIGLDDQAVAKLWGNCERVAALRRTEGFELPAFEGLACGARPLAFDQPHYSHWLESHADYVPEADSEALVAALTEVLATPARPVTESEREAFLDRFDWRRLAAGFWERAL